MSGITYTYYKQKGNKILFRYKQPGDPITRTKVVDFYQPTLYTTTTEDTGWKSIYDKNLKPVKFDNMAEAKSFANDYKGVESMGLNGNSNYANQFIIELFDGTEPDYEEFNIRVGMLDIEVDADVFPDPDIADWEVNAVTVYDSVEKKFYTFALRFNEDDQWVKEKCDPAVKDLVVEAFHFNTEKDLLRALMSHMDDHAYDLTTGWHSEGFDMPYIVNRCNKVFGEAYTRKMLSPFNDIYIKEIVDGFGKTRSKVDITGSPHLDYMVTYKKHTYTPRESYKLDFIAHAELGENKISYEEASSLHNLYRTDFQKFIDYNIIDVNLIKRLEEKLGLLSLVYAMSYYSLSNYEDTIGTTKIWEQLIAKFLYNKNVVPPFSRRSREERDFEGAFVKEPVPGAYEWVVSFDLNSLYPHIEMQWNIGPETHVPQDEIPEECLALRDKYCSDDILNGSADLSVLEKYDITMAANFEFYRKDKMSFFSEIKRSLYNQRKGFKKQMLEAERKRQEIEKEMRRRGLF